MTAIAAGEHHVLAATSEDLLFSWGCGEFGRLGRGDEDDCATPTQVPLPSKSIAIRRIAAGADCSFLLTRNGKLLAFGSNQDNKLALTFTAKGLQVSDISTASRSSQRRCCQMREQDDKQKKKQDRIPDKGEALLRRPIKTD